ncbi:MAG: AmpG family muropeptide MFS transporter [Candidatus Endonucleobacter bathymodioli]|uniref:AmpG family muropeptide MFS transporter n=1 Tax=Candidatus Endonucleibacter bathymodioli TaxID=539814 RepID=A0AA90NZJ0_9GAMM|nr:AmpG family muropeptide MFS transporter [Candidatus Endonucleobacter bathymodioli]
MLTVYCNKRVLILFLLGFSAGLPIMLVFSSLSFWLREADVGRSTIGFFSWVGLAYGFKWIWSPLVDRMPVPLLSTLLGKRRAWLLVSQIAIALSLASMAITNPATDLWNLAIFAVIVAFASATQDIVIDAYRIESGGGKLQAAFAAAYMVGYRLAMVLATAGVLSIAAWFSTPDSKVYEFFPWQVAYLTMACFMSIGIVTTLLISEPQITSQPNLNIKAQQWLATKPRIPVPLRRFALWSYEAVFSPFADFITRYRWHAVLILALISTYRISDIVMGIMANPFYFDLGYTKQEVATITKIVGVVMTLVGAAIAGGLMIRLGVMRVLFTSGLLVVLTNVLFAGLAIIGHDIFWLTVVVTLDNLAGGMAAAAFVAYLSQLTNVAYSATQYALFSSMMALFPKFIAGFSGVLVDSYGYAVFFSLSALMGVPTLFLIPFVANLSTKGGEHDKQGLIFPIDEVDKKE